MFLILFWIPATSQKWAAIFLLFLNEQHCPSIWEKRIIYLLKTDWVRTGMIHMLCTKGWTDIKYNIDIVSKCFIISYIAVYYGVLDVRLIEKINTYSNHNWKLLKLSPAHFQTPTYHLRPDSFLQTFKYFRFYKHT